MRKKLLDKGKSGALVNKGISAVLVAVMLTLSACGTSMEVPAESALPTPTEESASEEAVVVDEEKKEEETPKYVLDKNMLDNGDFHSELAHWGNYFAKGGKATFVAPAGEGKVSITDSGKVNYSVQIYYDGFELLYGGVYELSYDMSSTIPRTVESRIQINGSDYHAYTGEIVSVGEQTTTYSSTFTMTEGSDPAPRLCFNLGTPDGSENLGEHVIKIDNVSLKLVDASGIVEAVEENRSVDVNLNQVGYLPDARKKVVARVSAATSFDIVDENGKIVYSGDFSDVMQSKAAGEEVCQADFSDFTTPGTYTIVCEDGKTSYPFVIGNDVYKDILKDSVLFLYSQRCGVSTDKNVVGDYSHAPCHTKEAYIYGTNEKKDVQGGWHDAGDYGRYVVPGAVTVADLLLAYDENRELWDSSYGDSLGIPESGNGVSDILDEARFELDWMLQMQDEATGGVYHKITCKEFPSFVMPENETADLYLSPISHTATGDFAAVMAMAYTSYKDVDASFANECLEAAKKAWEYLEANPECVGFKNPDDILTGEYPDTRDPDERYWASIELYKVTGDERYKAYFSSVLDSYVLHGYGWAQVSSYGNMSYLSMEKSLQDDKYVKAISDSVVEKAGELLEFRNADPYMCALESYSWGSNMNVCNNARILLDAYRITGDASYKEAAYDQISYLLGQNPLSFCYVTGNGSVSATHVHHRPAIATGYTISGMVVGGPNENLEDPYAKATLSGTPAAKCYVDNEQSFSTNEVTIYWNSPFIYLMSYCQ